jgi:hypothetical protein
MGSIEEVPASPIDPVASERVAPKGRSRTRDALEIAVCYGLILLVIWTPRPWQRWLWMVAVAAVIVITCISFDGFKAMGLRRTNFLRSLWIPAAALLISGAAVAIAGRLGTLHLPGSILAFFMTYCAYAIWSGVQQFLLQGVFLLRFLRLIPHRTLAALTAAALFAAAHLPNPILTPITLLWGTAACLLFVRYRNVFTLAIAHAIFGISVALTIPGPVDHNMRVGLGYLTYTHHRHGSRPYPLSHPLPKP